MNFRKNSKQDQVGFQIAPMLDVVFLLLCFFVTTQLFSQWETEIDITLPTAESGDVPQRLPGEVIVNVLEDGAMVINGKSLQAGELQAMMGRLVELFPGQPVIVRADRDTAYKHVVRVLDICRQSDIWNISFATIDPQE